MQWLDDSARDVIVAEKIKNENRWFELKPQSGGIYDLKNLTLYFDSLGFLKITAPNINVFFSLYLLFYSLSLVAGFFIGYLIGDWFLGVVYLLILTFNAHLIFVQISVYQRYPPASVILWIVLSSILLINKKKNKYLIPILILALFSFLLHLSLLSVFPVFLIIISLSILKRIEVNNNVLRFGIFTTGIFALIICWLTISKNNLTTIIKSVSIPDETSRISSSASVYPYFKTFLVDLFNHPLNSFLLIISLFCFLFLLPLIYWKSKNNSLLI